MARLALFLPVLAFLLMIVSLISGGMVKLANGQEKTWCVAKPSSSDEELIANINYACEQIGDCRSIQAGGSCYYPNTYISHASAVMNAYYQMKGRNYWNCNFRGSALTVVTDPSYGGCKYA